MEGEISNFFMVLITSMLSASYCYGVSKIVPKGLPRLVLILPVVCLFVFLPLNFLSSFNLGCAASFSLSWLANFKLLLLSFDAGPLADPSLPPMHFIFLTCLPIVKVQEPTHKPTKKHGEPQIKTTRYENRRRENRPVEDISSIHNTSKDGLKSTSHYVKKAMLLPFIFGVYAFKDYMYPQVVIQIYIMYIYISLDLALASVGIIAQAMLGLKLKRPFNQPYLSTSIGNHWGRRWNLISSNILRLAVYLPSLQYSSSTLGPKLARSLAIMMTFVVSALMHELLWYQVFRVWPTWGFTWFFFLQGLSLAVEDGLKDKFTFPRRLPRLTISLLILGFVATMFKWCVMLDMMQLDVETRVIEEAGAVAEFLIDLAMASKEKFCYLLLCYLKHH